MPLVINHNLMAMNASRNFTMAFDALAGSTAKLSSGLRITTSADDAAGLAVSELMRAEIAALNQGVRNASDAQSLLATADGALGVIDEKLIRMKELAEQSATGTYTSSQRMIMNTEFALMRSEITRIANATKFNGVFLLNGNLSGTGTNGLKIHFGPTNSLSQDYYFISLGDATASALGIGASGSAEAFASARNLENRGTSTFQSVFAENPYDVSPADIQAEFSGQTYTFYSTSGGMPQTHYMIFNSGDVLIYKYGPGYYDYQGRTTVGTSISTQTGAQLALSTIDAAITSKDTIRANIGAYINRLSNTVSQLSIQAENLQAAESRIRDVDVAMEMTNFVNNQIKSQAAIAMLAQANMLPQMALTLIGG